MTWAVLALLVAAPTEEDRSVDAAFYNMVSCDALLSLDVQVSHVLHKTHDAREMARLKQVRDDIEDAGVRRCGWSRR